MKTKKYFAQQNLLPCVSYVSLLTKFIVKCALLVLRQLKLASLFNISRGSHDEYLITDRDVFKRKRLKFNINVDLRLL